jgi:hypothetical protein
MTGLTPARTLHLATGIIPATLTVLFAGLIALIALALDSGRRQYALDLADRFVDLASVLAGIPRPQAREATKRHGERPPASAQGTLPFDNDQLRPGPG